MSAGRIGPGRGLAVLALLLNALTWGLSWWPFRFLQGQGLHSLWSTVLIYGSAAALVTLWRPGAWSQLRRTPSLWLIMLASGCTNLGFNWGVTIGDVARVVLLFYLTPLWTLVLARWLLGERADAGVGLRVAMAVGGAMLVLTSAPHATDVPASHDASLAWLADVLAIAGGFFFALNNVMLRRCAQLPDEGRSLAMFVGGTLVSLTVATLGSADVGVMAGTGIDWPPALSLDWLVPALLLALAFLAANLALQYGASRLPANVTAVVMPGEIVFAAVSAAWWAGEPLTPRLLMGGALILGATALAARPRRR